MEPASKDKKIRIHSIYIKFLAIFTITIVLSSVLSGTIMYKLVESYLIASRMDDLKSAADTISDYVTQYLTSDEYVGEFVPVEHDKNEYFYNLYSLMKISNQTMGANIFITDDRGYVGFSYPLLPDMADKRIEHGSRFLNDSIVANLILDNGRYRFPNKEQYVPSLRTDGYVVDKNHYHGLFRDEKVPFLTISRRLVYIEPETRIKQVYGTVCISVSTPEILEARQKVILYFMLSTCIAVLIQVIVLSISTKRITEPVRALQEASRRLAAGSFERNVIRTTKDEIGDLVDSFNNMTIALENLDRVRNDFIANVSHELRTPMTSIGGFIDGIMDGVIPPEKHEYYLKIVRSEISRLSTLVNELLDIAKMQSGNMEFHFTVFDINVDIRNCIIKLEPLINDKELQVELDLDNEQENVYGDRNSLQRVLINLIQNAIKFTPKGGTIKVYTKRLKDKVEVNVEDTGIGISKEDQAMIFERFFKSDKSRSEDKKGTGLGLSIVKKILIAHDQDIKVDSSLGKGSKFTFTVARPPKEHS